MFLCSAEVQAYASGFPNKFVELLSRYQKVWLIYEHGEITYWFDDITNILSLNKYRWKCRNNLTKFTKIETIKKKYFIYHEVANFTLTKLVYTFGPYI